MWVWVYCKAHFPYSYSTPGIFTGGKMLLLLMAFYSLEIIIIIYKF